MQGTRVDDRVHLGGDAINRFYHPRGMGRIRDDGTLSVTWEEAAYLLCRGDIEAVDGMGPVEFLATAPGADAIARWLAYRDLRERGYYVGTDTIDPVDLAVRPRGASPTSDDVAYPLRVLTESSRRSYKAFLRPGAIAIVDDETEITYAEISDWVVPSGDATQAVGTVQGKIVGDRVFVDSPPTPLYDTAFFGQPIEGMDVLALNALEARYLASTGELSLETDRDVTADEASDGRYAVYAALRDGGLAPRSGLKFGADFRVYTDVDSAADPGHSDLLVSVERIDAQTSPKELSRAVRLATGVRKRQIYALIDEDVVAWRVVDRLTP